MAEPPLAPGVTQATIYLRDGATGTFVPLVTKGTPHRARASVVMSISWRRRRT